MCKRSLPNPKFELVEKIRNKDLIKIKSMFR